MPWVLIDFDSVSIVGIVMVMDRVGHRGGWLLWGWQEWMSAGGLGICSVNIGDVRNDDLLMSRVEHGRALA